MKHSGRGHLIPVDEAALYQQLLQTLDPFLVVREHVVVRQGLAGAATHVDIPLTARPHGQRECERLTLPIGMEPLPLGLRDHAPLTVPTAEIRVRSITHELVSGPLGSPVPIIESRVTSAANC